MNRLVIIGNGFDLAHGLPTSYRDFIDDFWKNFKYKCKSEEYQKLICTHDLYDGYYNGYAPIENFNDLKSNLENYSREYGHNYDINNFTCSRNKDIIFGFRSDFFKLINKKNSENWIDIETEYYNSLISIAKSTPVKGINKSESVKELNDEFELIKKLLYDYLKHEICDKYEFEIEDSNEIFNYFKNEIDDINNTSFQTYSTLFLSFNYTPTARVYHENLKSKLYSSNVNYIHGEIGNNDNPDIIFGYGDDKDENYKLIKNFNDNVFLENIKPFEYKNNDNFENLLDFLNRSKYIVYLVGHSCGLSDKYLLNQILENENCNSIITLYRNFEDGTDDFRNKPRDISRHFDNDRLSTIRIVNKKKSRSIPQDIRFKIKTDNLNSLN